MRKKHLGCFLLGASTLLCSCVDNTYDLNKGVVMDVKIEGNRLALPIGNLQAMLLDSLISVEEIDMISQMDGVYSISMSDTIDPISIEIDEIKFTIPPIEENTDFDFDKVELENPHLDKSTSKINLDMPPVSVSDLNDELPDLSEDRLIELANKNLQDAFAAAKVAAELAGNTNFTFPISNYEIKEENLGIQFKFDYQIPDEIASIDTIYFADRDKAESATTGSLIEFRIVHPELLEGIDKTVAFEINFPEMFRISLVDDTDASYIWDTNQPNRLIYNAKVSANNGENETVLRFYMDELIGLTEFKDENNLLLVDDQLLYSVTYGLDGNLEVSTTTTLDDLGFEVKMDAKLGCRDVIGSTNPITVELDNLDEGFAFEAHFDNLQHIQSVDYVDFDEDVTKLHIHTEMEGDFEPFHFEDGSYLLLEIPREFVIDTDKSKLPVHVEYIDKDENGEHAFKIYDIDGLCNSDWYLALDRININQEVEEGKLDVVGKAQILTGANGMTFKGVPISLSKVLPKLQKKEISFTMDPMDLVIQDAQIHTEKIRSAVKDTVRFELNELVGNNIGIGEIHSVEFTEPVPVNLTMEFTGLDIVDTHVELVLDVKLPPFLSLSTTPGSEGVAVKNGVLHIDYDYHTKGEALDIVLALDKLDFTMLEGGCIAPVIKPNGDTYLSYATDITFNGEAVIDTTAVGLDIMNQRFSIDVKFTAGEIAVQKFAGKYNGTIDPVTESVDLDLGENLEDILDGEGNSIKLACPQIMIGVDNAINVPVFVDFEIAGKDAEGNETMHIVQRDVPIKPAHYDEETGAITPDSTKLMITNKSENVPLGYHPIVIPELSDLLNKLPKAIDFTMTPRIDTESVHHIDLSQPLTFGADYKVVVPLEFDELNFTYSDTIAGIGEDLGEMMEMFSNVEVGLKMNVKNSMPLQLTLVATPLDKDGNRVEDIELSSFEIPAGDGKAYDDAATQSKPIHFAIKSKTGDISALDQLMFEVSAESVTSTAGGAALRGDQGIKIENIVIEVAGDIEMNLDEMGEEKE